MQPSVLIVIPTLNEEKHIGRCLETLMKLDYPKDRVRICVVDSFSTDRTTLIAASHGVKVMRIERKTIAFSRNEVALNTDDEFVAFLDADCLPAPWWMQTALKHFATPEVVAVGSYYSILESESNALQTVWSQLCRDASTVVHDVDWLPSGNLIVRGAAFRDSGGFNESLVTCEDVDLGIRLRQYGRIVCDPNVVVYHLGEPSTFKELFRKEFWHATNNLSGVWSHGLRVSELPSLISPLVFGLGLAAAALGVASSRMYLLLGLGASVSVLMAYTIRGYGRTGRAGIVLAIYSVYLSARSLSGLREIFLAVAGAEKRRNVSRSRRDGTA
jgi:glycosyltransferase involved in cell wall biosynthesis